MTDRVLTEQEIDGYAESWKDNEPVMKLITSHRTLHLRHRQLLRRVAELEKAQAMAVQIVEATEKLKAENEFDD